MSHNEVNKSRLTSVNETLLKKCLEILAQKLKGKIAPTFSDYSGNEISEWMGDKIIAAIKTSEVPRGIGIILKGGKLQFIGDGYGVSSAYNKLKFQIESTYESTYRQLGAIFVLSEMGYMVETPQRIGSKTLIKAEKNE